MNDLERKSEAPPDNLSWLYLGDNYHDHHSQDRDRICNSRNSHSQHMIFWYTPIGEILTDRVLSQNKKRYVCFDISADHSLITSTELEFKTPEVQSRDGVEIAFVKNPCLHFIKEGKLVLNDQIRLDCGPEAMTVLQNYFAKKPDQLDHLLGNDQDIQWKTTIPGKYFNFPLLVDHSENEVKSLPLFYFSKHYYLFDFERDFSKLLRMRIKNDDDEWNEIPFDKAYLLTDNLTLEQPVVTVSYRDIPLIEQSWRLEETQPLLYNNFIIHRTKNPCRPGKTVEIKPDLPSDVGVQAFFFYAFCNKKQELGLRSDFLNNHGENPIETFDFTYGTTTIKEKGQRVEKFQDIKAYQHYPSKPRDSGITTVPLCHRPGSTYTDRAVDLSDKNVNFSFKMRESNDEDYTVVLIAMVVEKISPERRQFPTTTPLSYHL